MARRIESFFVQGPAGRLEALLEEPEAGQPVEAALVCHPHPQFGGTMHNKVVYRMARGLRKTGCVVLRFNYRGVNLSEGEYGHIFGEVEDAKAALGELRGRYPQLPVLIAGFSFGSRVSLHVAEKDDALTRVIAVGFPTQYSHRDYAYNVRIPKYFIHSTHDEFGPKPEFQEFFDSLPEPKQLEWIEAKDHFFAGALDEFEGAMERVGTPRV